MKKFALLLLFIPLFFLGACQTGSGETPLPMTYQAAQKPQELPLENAELGSNSLRIMIARTDDEKRTGLMYRESLANDEGMLFVYDEPVQMQFWMKNTRLPLDIVFFSSELTVTESIKGMVPGWGIPENQLPRYSTQGKAQYALELASGAIELFGIQPGDRLKIPLPLLFTGE